MGRFASIAPAAASVCLAFSALAPQAAFARSDPFLREQGPDLWRASRLVGVPVRGPGGRDIGSVSDVLLDQDGRAVAVVVDVGGFLGVGRKDVALPFASVRFSRDPRPAGPPPNPPSAALGGPVGTTAGVAGGRVTGLAAMPSAPPGATAAPARSQDRPDHATVDLTADQLRAAPAFVFAR